MALTYEARPGTRILRPGRGRLARGQVAEIQRSRLLAAAVEAVDGVGYQRMTVAEVISRARVSRKTFYDLFADREECFLAAFELAIARWRAAAENSYAGCASWRDAVRAALARLLELIDDEPGLARLCIVEALGAGEQVLARRAVILDELAAVVDRGRAASSAREPPAVTAEGVVGAVVAVVHARIIDGGQERFSDLLGPLMSMIVLPYLGPRAAQSELGRLPETPRSGSRRATPARPDPLDGLKMRLTYRTVRVLSVISQRPGASNKEIAERSGITDQGQISKLLRRLARLGLIQNLGGGQERGAANAWHLTLRGAQVEHATRTR